MLLGTCRALSFGFYFYVLCASVLIVAKFAACDGKKNHGRTKRSFDDENLSYEDLYTTDTEHCDQSLIPVMRKFDVKKFSGLWYELAKTTSGYIDLYDGMWNITNTKTTSRFIYSARTIDDDCILPISGVITIFGETPGGLLLHYRTYSTLVKERIRVLHTDYETFAVIYTCLEMNEDGTCHPAGIFVSIWTRLPHVDVIVFNGAMSIVTKYACADPHSVSVTNRVAPCHDISSTTREVYVDKPSITPRCTNVANCAIHCPPCCRSRDNCIVCDCKSIILEDRDKCYSISECPFECLYEEKYRGCFTCKCAGLQIENFIPPGACNEVQEAGHCDLHCSEVCEESGGKGLTRFYYDALDRECLPFEYTGCGGNKNNFESRKECQSVCQGISFSENDGSNKLKTEACIFITTFIALLLHDF